MIEPIGIVLLSAIGILMLVECRNGLTLEHRLRAIDINMTVFLAGPSYNSMMFDLRKWTFAQFYPELAGAK